MTAKLLGDCGKLPNASRRGFVPADKVNVEELNRFEEKYRRLSGFWRWLANGFTVIVVLLCVNQAFDLRFFAHYMMYDYTLYYILFGLLLSMAFLYAPRRRWTVGEHVQILFYVDIVTSMMVLAIGLYFAWHAYDIDVKGWSRMAPLHAVIMAVIVWVIVIEAVWRTTGSVLAIVVLLGSFYPLVAEYMPGILEGVSFPFLHIAQYHIFSHDSTVGLLVRIYANIIVGYILFGIVVVETGGARFFINIALSLVGGTRGGTAKVAVVSSALFGSISGSSVANVITTGTVTIPAMKKAGFAPHFAGAVESCASTAGTFTPPIMGATAFIMASFINVNYSAVALSAALPALMYYISL
jgi:TRAP transporter 4TM/12TM fusion protein